MISAPGTGPGTQQVLSLNEGRNLRFWSHGVLEWMEHTVTFRSLFEIVVFIEFRLCCVVMTAWAFPYAVNGDSSLAVVSGLLVVVISWRAQALEHTGFSSCSSRAEELSSAVVARGRSCSTACGIFLDQGSNPHILGLAGGFFTTEPPGKPSCNAFLKFSFRAAHIPGLSLCSVGQ